MTHLNKQPSPGQWESTSGQSSSWWEISSPSAHHNGPPTPPPMAGPPLAPPPGVAPLVSPPASPPPQRLPSQPVNLRAWLIAGGVVLLIGALVAGGLALFSSGPSVVTRRTYVNELCAAMDASASDWLPALDDFAETAGAEDASSEDGLDLIEATRKHVERAQSFNEQFQLSGLDGEEFRQDVQQASAQFLAGLERTASNLSRLSADGKDDSESVANEVVDQLDLSGRSNAYSDWLFLAVIVEGYNASARTQEVLETIDGPITDERSCSDYVEMVDSRFEGD